MEHISAWLDHFGITVESTTNAGTGSFPSQSVRPEERPYISLQLVPGEMRKQAKKGLLRNKDFRDIAYVIREQKNFCYLFVQKFFFSINQVEGNF